mgnify:CR=1 FL=1
MEDKEFFKRLSKKEYNALEKELLKDYRKTKDVHSRFLLGICYSEQYKRKDDAITIFKDLLSFSVVHILSNFLFTKNFLYCDYIITKENA